MELQSHDECFCQTRETTWGTETKWLLKIVFVSFFLCILFPSKVSSLASHLHLQSTDSLSRCFCSMKNSLPAKWVILWNKQKTWESVYIRLLSGCDLHIFFLETNVCREMLRAIDVSSARRYPLIPKQKNHFFYKNVYLFIYLFYFILQD